MATHIPFGLEVLEAAEGPRNGLFGKDGLVLLQRSVAYLGVVGFGYRVFEKGLFELVESDDDAEELGERVLKVALGASVCQFNFLEMTSDVSGVGVWSIGLRSVAD
jgi:hypothetical protein